jgi:hypothetical protein
LAGSDTTKIEKCKKGEDEKGHLCYLLALRVALGLSVYVPTPEAVPGRQRKQLTLILPNDVPTITQAVCVTAGEEVRAQLVGTFKKKKNNYVLGEIKMYRVRFKK